MKKRLRRKLHVGEFAQKGVGVAVNLKQPPWPDRYLFCDFGDDLHQQGICLSMGGRTGCVQMRGLATACKGSPDHGSRPGMSAADVELLVKYLQDHPLVDAFWVGQPRDMNHPDGDHKIRDHEVADRRWTREFNQDDADIDRKLGADGDRCLACKSRLVRTPVGWICLRPECGLPFTKTPL